MELLVFGAVAAVSGATAWRCTRGQHPTIRVICTGTFVSSALVGQLVVSEVLGIGQPKLRAVLWQALTGTLLALIGFIFPAIYAGSVADVCRGGSARLVLALTLYAGYLGCFYLLGNRLPIDRDEPDPSLGMNTWYSLRQDLLACISCVGITIMACLCGISSVTAPYTAFFFWPKPVTENDIEALNSSIQSTEDLITSKEMHIGRLQLSMRNRNRKSATSLVAKMMGSLQPDDLQKELQASNEELQALQRLHGEMIDDREQALQRLQQQEYQATLRGRLHNMAFALFACYCIYRVVNGYLRMAWWMLAYENHEPGSGGPRDAIVLALARGAHRLSGKMSTDSWMRVIGAFMSAAVFATAMSGMLRTLARVQRSLLRQMKWDASMLTSPTIVANFVGIYVLAIATILRLNIPKSMSAPILSALASPLRVASVQLLNDVVLCSTSTIMIAALLISARVQEPAYDEEAEKYD